jgi:hypothetical protein
MPLLNSLVMEAKLIQVISMATKHANESFFSRLGDFFLHISLGVEGWLWTGWVVRLGRFDCFLFVIVGGRNKLGSSLLTFVLTPLKANTQFVFALSSTRLKSSSIIFSLTIVLSTRAVKYATSYFSSVFSLVAWKSLPLREPHTVHGGDKIL